MDVTEEPDTAAFPAVVGGPRHRPAGGAGG